MRRLLCKLGWHRWGPWGDLPVENPLCKIVGGPSVVFLKIRICKRCFKQECWHKEVKECDTS